MKNKSENDLVSHHIREILKSDPRPAYHNDPDRIYGFPFSEFEIKFRVENSQLFVVDVKKI